MNYKNTGLSELKSFSTEFEDYSLGQIILAVTNRKPEGVSLREWLRDVSDEDLYTAIETTKIIERP